MIAKNFPCKLEEVPVIGEFVVNSAERNIDDFSAYPAVFNPDYFATLRSKIEVCKDLLQSSAITNELKFVTNQLYRKVGNFRVAVNVLEGYFKLGANRLDIAVKDSGIKEVRNDITRGNVEGLFANMQTALAAVKRNQIALNAVGMKQSLLDEINNQLRTIRELNEQQNGLIGNRNSLTVENVEKFNDLWNSLKPILNAAKIIYKGVDEAKLKDYTVSQLRKRINAER
ncbi:MAG: hypothetical protein LBP63_05820 [Prevotellaceae bacterium]|jgi:hypothetical protein|nr:hypothetical protein [Prevotellaceae bacterium]